MKSGAAKKTKSRFEKMIGGEGFGVVARAVLSAVILWLVCDWHAIYEEDQMAKGAQVMALARDGNWRHFATVTNYYTKDLFSAYYLIGTAFYKVSGLPVVEALNVLSLMCGVIFFSVTPVFLRRVFQLPPWLSWCALVNAPILIISFNYGNEAAVAVTAAAVAAWALSWGNRAGRICGALGYVTAAYCRCDYLFLWPALALLTLVRGEGGVDWRRSAKNLLEFAGASAVPGVIYLAVVLRHFPKPDFLATVSTLKLFAAFFVYSAGWVNTAFAVAGLVICVVKRQAKFLWLLLATAQFLPYVAHLDSPKYILPTVVVMVVFALVGMLALARRSPRRLAWVLVLPWIFAVTPYGIFAPDRAPFWYVPTSDGPLPTGGYASFYGRVRTGFYQARYDQEVAEVGAAMALLDKDAGAELVGYFNRQALELWEAREGRWDWPAQDWPFWLPLLEVNGASHDEFMIRMSYFYGLQQPAGLRERLEAAYREGRVKGAAGAANDPFPEVIQVGSRVAAGTDRELGARILFANGYYQNNQQMRRGEFVADFQGTSWISRERFVKERQAAGKVLYLDSAWVCLGEEVPGAVYYSMRFPLVYGKGRKVISN